MTVTLNVQSSQDILPFIVLLDARQIKAQSDSLDISIRWILTHNTLWATMCMFQSYVYCANTKADASKAILQGFSTFSTCLKHFVTSSLSIKIDKNDLNTVRFLTQTARFVS